MNKKRSRKLKVKRETVRELSAAQVDQVGGGYTERTCYYGGGGSLAASGGAVGCNPTGGYQGGSIYEGSDSRLKRNIRRVG